MTSLRRLLSGILLGSFLALVGVQTFHTHTSTAPEQSDCAICKIAVQTPTLLNTPTVVVHALHIQRAIAVIIIRSVAQPCSVSHGLAPPLL